MQKTKFATKFTKANVTAKRTVTIQIRRKRQQQKNDLFDTTELFVFCTFSNRF